MVELTDSQLEAALERGRQAQLSEPRAVKAHYSKARRRIVVDLNNGCTFAFPPDTVQGLQDATPEQLAQVQILGRGFGLHWEDLDADLSVPGLLAGIFGTKAFMARQAGKVKSPAKAAAARANGMKGGRPRKANG